MEVLKDMTSILQWPRWKTLKSKAMIDLVKNHNAVLERLPWSKDLKLWRYQNSSFGENSKESSAVPQPINFWTFLKIKVKIVDDMKLKSDIYG